MAESIEFYGESETIVLRRATKHSSIKVEVTDGDYDAVYVINKRAQIAFHKDLYTAVIKHGKAEFVWYGDDFYERG